MSLTRRQVLAASAATGSLAGKPAVRTLGVQLYTVRSVLPDKPAETLRAIERLGYREVEATRAGIDRIWPHLRATALKPVSIHLEPQLFTSRQSELAAAIADVHARGFRYAVCPAVPREDRGGTAAFQRIAAALNKGGELARAAGMTLAYHNHAFEFAPAGGGRTLLDVLLAETDPGLVQLEMDIMWVTVAGVNPADLLARYKGRVPLMHIKDLHRGVQPRFDEGIPREAFAEAGRGVVDIPGVLRAAGPAGVKHFFVEQDQTPGDPLSSLRVSAEYLRNLQV